ncbi:CC154-like protein, partial [Mya arenaria]
VSHAVSGFRSDLDLITRTPIKLGNLAFDTLQTIWRTCGTKVTCMHFLKEGKSYKLLLANRHVRTSNSCPFTFRPSGQNSFPTKYDHLPAIHGESPRSPDGTLVPLRSNRKGSPMYAHRKDGIDDTEERVRQLEMRLTVSEKSNRALLEEVLRLQNDLRNTSRRSEDVLREERESRQQLSEAIKISNDLISQLSVRIKETEEKIEDEKDTLATLFSHTKNVEKSVVVSQQEIHQRRDAQQLKLQELKAELNETKSSRSQLEQVTYTLTEEVRSLKNRVETQQAEFSNMLSDVRNRARKLEDEGRTHLESMRKQSEMHSMSDIGNTQLRGQVETRLSELRDVLMDLRGKHETEQSERRNLEKMMQAKINELTGQLSEQSRKREENMHTVDMVMREKEHAAQAEKLQLSAKMSGTVEDVNKRLAAKEMKIREDIQAKYQQLEKLVHKEQASRKEYERLSRDEADRKWQSLKKALEEELLHLKEAITIHEVGTQREISSVNNKLQIATSTLQQAIGGVSQTISSNTEKMRRELKEMLNEQQQGSTRALSDMDARMTAVKQRINNMEDMLDAKVSSASQTMSERLNERLEAITKWQDATGDTLRELGRSVQTIPQDIYQLDEKFKLLKSDMDSRTSSESDARSREMEELRQEVLTLKARLDRQPKPASLQDIESVNVGVRKLADNLQTVKTVLGMKIQSEQKLRITGLEDLQAQINQLKILSGSSLKYDPPHRSQMDDLDTGLGWDDLGSMGTYPNTPQSEDRSRQRMTDASRPSQQPIIEEREEESPFESKGLKNMNIPSPSPKAVDEAVNESPRFGGKPDTSRQTPGNVTPDNWKTTPRGDIKSPEAGQSGKKTPQTGRSEGTKTPNNGKKSPGHRSQGNRTPGNRGQGNQSPGNQTPTNAQGNTPRNQDSGLDDRGEEVEHLQKQIDDIKRAIEPMVGRSHPLFVKDDDRGRNRGNSPEGVNNWGVYNAYKWLMWKSKLMYKLWEVRARQQTADRHPTPIVSPKPKSPVEKTLVESPRNKGNLSSKHSARLSPKGTNNSAGNANAGSESRKSTPTRSRNPSMTSVKSAAGNSDDVDKKYECNEVFKDEPRQDYDRF